jgi:hypothetical protein
MDARPAEGGRLHALVFPRLTHRRGRLDLRRLTVDAALKKLRESLFRAAAPPKASDVFAPSPAPSRHRVDELVRRLASSVPCFDCRAGSQAYAARRSVAAPRGSEPRTRRARGAADAPKQTGSGDRDTPPESGAPATLPVGVDIGDGMGVSTIRTPGSGRYCRIRPSPCWFSGRSRSSWHQVPTLRPDAWRSTRASAAPGT